MIAYLSHVFLPLNMHIYICLSKFILVTQITYKYDSTFITFFPSTQYAYVCLSKFILVTQITYKYDSIFITFFPSTQYAYLYMFVQVYPCNTTYTKICYHIYMHIEWKERMILHIFIYNVMSDFSGGR